MSVRLLQAIRIRHLGGLVGLSFHMFTVKDHLQMWRNAPRIVLGNRIRLCVALSNIFPTRTDSGLVETAPRDPRLSRPIGSCPWVQFTTCDRGEGKV
jgi:hypothetical protein